MIIIKGSVDPRTVLKGPFSRSVMVTRCSEIDSNPSFRGAAARLVALSGVRRNVDEISVCLPLKEERTGPVGPQLLLMRFPEFKIQRQRKLREERLLNVTQRSIYFLKGINHLD